MDNSDLVVGLLGPSSFTPILTIVNIFLLVFSGGRGHGGIKNVLTNFNVLVVNVRFVDGSVSNLTRDRGFISIFAGFDGPILNVLINVILATIVRSSSTSINVLRTLTLDNSISFTATFPVVLNRGVNAYVATLVSSVNADGGTGHATIIRLCFGIVNILLTTTLFCNNGTVFGFSFLGSDINTTRVTVVRSIFGIISALILLPFAGRLRFLTYGAIGADSGRATRTPLLSSHFLVGPDCTIRGDRRLASGVTSLIRGSISAMFSLIGGCSSRGTRGIGTGRGGVSECRRILRTCLIGVDTVGLASRSDGGIFLLRRTVRRFRGVNSCYRGILGVGGDVVGDGAIFSRGTGCSLSIVVTTAVGVVGLAVSTFEGNSLRGTRGIRPLRSIVSGLGGRLGGERLGEVRRNGYSISRNFLCLSVVGTFRHVSSRYSDLTISVVRLRTNSCGIRRCAERLGTASGGFIRTISGCLRGCSLDWRTIY